jgi:hypothetical protein
LMLWPAPLTLAGELQKNTFPAHPAYSDFSCDSIPIPMAFPNAAQRSLYAIQWRAI